MRRGLIAVAAAICAFTTITAAAQADSVVPKVAWGNDFTCQPTAKHPRPVVLVHGLGATAEANWGYVGPKLKADGYCVYALTYGIDPRTKLFGAPGGVLRMEDSAPELAAFVDRVRAAAGTRKVDLVGHSEGTVMPRYYLERLGGAAKVGRFVALTPLWRGTNLAGVPFLRDLGARFGLDKPLIGLVAAFCGSCPEFLTGSDYLDDLNADGEAVPGIKHTNIVTRYDELVSPPTSGLMRDGGTNIVLQDVCPADVSEHVAVAFDPAVLQLIRNALESGRSTKPC